MITNTLCVSASENILRSVGVAKNNNSYVIEITSAAPAKMNKTILSANRIILNLKDISLSTNASAKFGKDTPIDNVVLEPHGNNGVNIFIQGDNIAYSTIEFKEPTAVETAEDTVKSSFSSLFGVISGSSLKNRALQFGILLFFLFIIIGEIRFIKSKYDELKSEKSVMLRDLAMTNDFQEYLPGYGRRGLNKPYTTPVYSSAVNTNVIKPKKLYSFKTPETMTLNSLLYNRNREERIISRIVNNIPEFGELAVSGRNEKVANTTSPIEKSRLKNHIAHLEKLTEKYKRNSIQQDINLQKRLDRIY